MVTKKCAREFEKCFELKRIKIQYIKICETDKAVLRKKVVPLKRKYLK